jgi:hypothetical protein
MKPYRIVLRLAALAALGASAASAAAQGQGYGVGEWNLVSQGGASVCNVVLTNRYIPEQANYRAFVRPGPRCTDWRARSIAMWVVRGNTLKIADGYGREIAGLGEQNPNLYAAGEWQLHRVGTGYVPGPGPGPGYPPPVDRPGQGYGVGEWNFINQANGSVCQVVLTDRLIPAQNNYRAYVRGGPRCFDWIARSVAMWVVRGNTLKLADAGGREIAALNEQGPDTYVGGGLVLQRRRAGY